MRIGIMGAMIEEIEPILSSLDNHPPSSSLEYILKNLKELKVHSIADNRYFEARYKGNTLVVAYSKIGKVYASLTASVLVQHFNIDYLLFSGVAGALREDLRIGDLICATKLCQHDLDISAFGHPFGYVPEGKIYIPASKELILLAKEIAKEKGIELKEGIIATGDQFVADPARKEWIRKTFNADAIEMEGAAVAVVCDAFDVPFFVLRSISDSANEEAVEDFDQFLRESSKRSGDFILTMVDRLIQS